MIENIELKKCTNKCCLFKSIISNKIYTDLQKNNIIDKLFYQYHRSLFINWSDEMWAEWRKTHNQTKAGVIIYDAKTSRILIIRSYYKKFGFPKGSIENDEDMKNAAIRELKEETGIILNTLHLKECINICNQSGNYFLCDFNTLDDNDKKKINQYTCIFINEFMDSFEVDTIIWIKLECLKKMLLLKKIDINIHCRVLIESRILDNLFVNNNTF